MRNNFVEPETETSGKAKYDLCIMNARVMDPESGLDDICNIAVSEGKIAAVTKTPVDGRLVIDATGCIASPGFLMQANLLEQGCTCTVAGDSRAAKDAPYLLELARRTGGAAWMQTLARLTLEPAERNGLAGKGRLQAGYDADIVVFDPDIIAIGKKPQGVRHVIIGGEVKLGFPALPKPREFCPTDTPRVRRPRSRLLRSVAG